MTWFAAAARFVAALPAGLLPRRLWPSVSTHVPVFEAALASGLVTAACGFVVGVSGFLDYASAVASANNEALLQIAARQRGGGTGPAVVSSAPMFLGALSALVFAFTTVRGWCATYLLVSGGTRAVAALLDDPFGDPLLTVADAMIRGRRAKRRAAEETELRERLEGPEVPDEIVPAIDLGIPEAIWAVVASRRKAGWDEGVTVVTDDGWYRIGRPHDRRFPGGLRRVYPLWPVPETAVLRRAVRYDLKGTPPTP